VKVESLEGKISQDALEFLNQIDTLSHSAKRDLLVLLLQKYALLSTTELLLDKRDFDDIISASKGLFAHKTMPVKLQGSDIPLDHHQIANLCVIESTISVLNKHKAFNKIPHFKEKR
jgi:hypothetical protein